MTEELRLVLTYLSILLSIVVCALHILSFILQKRVGLWLGCINIVLHILLFVCFFLIGASLTEITFALMVSVCVYSLSAYIAHIRRRDRDDV